MKRESRTVDRSHQGDSSLQRHLPLVDLLVDTRTELMELAVASGLKVLTTMLEEDRTAIWWSSLSTSGGSSGLAHRHGGERGRPRWSEGRDQSTAGPRERRGSAVADVSVNGRRGSLESSGRRTDAPRRGDATVRMQSRAVAGDDGHTRHQQERREPPVRRKNGGAARRLAIHRARRARTRAAA